MIRVARRNSRRRGKSWPSPATVHTVVLDFDGVFTDNKVYVSENGEECVRCDRADGLAMDLVRRYAGSHRGAPCPHFFILSKERNPVVSARARKLRLDCRQGVRNKLQFIRSYLERRHPRSSDPMRGLICLGNDLNDFPLMEAAGFSVAPADAHPLIRRIASVVLPQRGGGGFVRAFVEKFLGLEKLSAGEINELVSDC